MKGKANLCALYCCLCIICLPLLYCACDNVNPTNINDIDIRQSENTFYIDFNFIDDRGNPICSYGQVRFSLLNNRGVIFTDNPTLSDKFYSSANRKYNIEYEIERVLKCSECNGTRGNDCRKCSGSGKVLPYTWKIVCGCCQGTGSIIHSYCGGSASLYCPACFGSGYISNAPRLKPAVYGTGRSKIYVGYDDCSQCSGLGYVKCDRCNGTGYFGTEESPIILIIEFKRKDGVMLTKYKIINNLTINNPRPISD